MPQSVLESPCWHAAGSAYPMYAGVYDYFCTNDGKPLDRCGGPLMVSLGITADSQYAAFAKDHLPEHLGGPKEMKEGGEEGVEGGKKAKPPFPYLMAVPFTVSEDACEADVFLSASLDGASGGPRYMCDSAVTMLTDMITSFHMMLALFPATPGHVSVSLQTYNNVRAPSATSVKAAKLECGKRYVAISKIDKMGRRICFCGVRYIGEELCEERVRNYTAQSGPTTAEGAVPVGTVAELERALDLCQEYYYHKHIKSILSEQANSSATKGRDPAASPISPVADFPPVPRAKQ